MNPDGADSGAAGREEELLRANAGLAAEIRNLVAGRAESPRVAPGSAARRVSRLVAERDAAVAERGAFAAQLEIAEAEINDLRGCSDDLGAQMREQARRIDELNREVARLRGSWPGFLRRLRARLLWR